MTIWDSMSDERKQQEGEALMHLANAGVMVIHAPAAPRREGCSEACLWHAVDADGTVIDGGSASALWSFHGNGYLTGIIAVQRVAVPGEDPASVEQQRELFRSILHSHSRTRINWGNVVAYLSVLLMVGILLWIFIDYTNIPR